MSSPLRLTSSSRICCSNDSIAARLGGNADKVNPGKVLAENLDTLMRHYHIRSDNALAHLVGCDQKTIWRIRHRTQSPTLEMTDKIAGVFCLQAWQILVPGLDRRRH